MNKKNKLALFGGKKTIRKNFLTYNSIGNAELKNVTKVMKSGKLSSFLASSSQGFTGGNYVQKFEKSIKDFYKVKYAITVNSWTSGLIAAIGSLGLNPGDEIITTPFSMCATSTSIVHWNLIPVFADINYQTYCIDSNSIEKKITKKTKAILLADIFGISHNVNKIKKIAKKHNLKIISDAAQAPYSFVNRKLAGTMSDIGGYSYNYHKHIHTGEGGVVVTNNKIFAQRVMNIRNHAEVTNTNKKNLSNMIGYNFRMGEIEASIGIAQLKKLKKKVKKNQLQAKYLNNRLSKLKGLEIPKVPRGYTHSYYIYPIKIKTSSIGINRSILFKALKAEGVQGIFEGYINLHMLPMFQKKIAYGKKGFPWKFFKNKANYKKGICPNAELLHDKELICFELCLFDLSVNDLDLICKAFEKTWQNIQILKKL